MIFVWDDVLTDWSHGMVVVQAPNLKAAYKQILLDEGDGMVLRECKESEPKAYKTGERTTAVCWGGG